MRRTNRPKQYKSDFRTTQGNAPGTAFRVLEGLVLLAAALFIAAGLILVLIYAAKALRPAAPANRTNSENVAG